MAEQGGKQSTYLFAPILLIAVLFACAVIRGLNILAQSGFGSAILVAAPLILATYGLMALAVAGRGTVDLAVGPLVAFINVTVVKLNDLGAVTGPFGVFVVALGIGVIYQLLFAFVILFVRVQPIIVALSGSSLCPASISSSYRARAGQRGMDGGLGTWQHDLLANSRHSHHRHRGVAPVHPDVVLRQSANDGF